MIKFWRRDNKNRAKDKVLQGQFGDLQISSKKNLKYRFQDNIISANFGNEIILSPSGQTKIDNLNSCLSLVRSDFILF